MCLRLIWLLFKTDSSLWADWVHQYKLSDSSFWSLDNNSAGSSTWKEILSLRPLAALFIRGRLGNGTILSFLWDNWTPFSPLNHYFGPSGTRQTLVPINARVSASCNSCGWFLRGARSPEAENLQVYLTTVLLPSISVEEDSYFWMIDGEELDGFSANKTRNILRNRAPTPAWTRIVWFKGAIPHHSFTMWLVFLNCLPTRDRLARWSTNTSPTCCLCGAGNETRDHLFLVCHVSASIWEHVMHRLGYQWHGFTSWNAFTDWLCTKDNVTPSTLKLLAAHTTVYNIWAERNKRLHDGAVTSPAGTFEMNFSRVQ